MFRVKVLTFFWLKDHVDDGISDNESALNLDCVTGLLGRKELLYSVL